MKPVVLFCISIFSLFTPVACNSSKKAGPPANPEADAAVKGDIPMLPVHKGDAWTYDVRLEIPADVSSPGAASVDATHQRVRTYLGKVSAASGLPETDCFEVTTPGYPDEREFIDIREDKILMRGSLIMRHETTRPMWLETPVPFVIAGMKPGTESPEVNAPGGSLSRKTQVVAREDVATPAGTFPSIRLLMTGMDGEIELRRTIWFAPGIGIAREEKTRYRTGKLILRETHQLIKIDRARK